MSTVTIRRVRRPDQAAVGALWTALLEEQSALDDRIGASEDARERWDNDFPMWVEDETRRMFVAEADCIVGFVTARRWAPPPIYQDEGEVFLDEIYVSPDARQQGIGTKLVAAVQTWADEVEAHRVRLSMLAENEVARCFWEAMGAEPLTRTLTMDRPGPTSTEDNEGTRKIGF
ncbi:MAG: N-acetyltransferase family protein [Salinivenus sp.]